MVAQRPEPAADAGQWLTRLALALLVLLSIAAVRPLFEPGYPSSWDGAAHLVRAKAMAELFLPNGHVDGWCPYWYNGFAPFQFYSPLFFIVVSFAHYALGSFASLLSVFKVVSVSGYVLLPLAVFYAARAFGISRFGSVCSAAAVPALSAMHGVGLQSLLFTGLVPQVFALPLFCLALAHFHIALERAGTHRLVLAALLVATVFASHIITSLYLGLAVVVYLIVRLRERGDVWMALRRTLFVFGGAGAMCLVVIVPAAVHRELRGPGTGWGELPLFSDFVRGEILGTTFSNALALFFVLGCKKRHFEEKFLTVLALLTFMLALGVITTGDSRTDAGIHQLTKHRTLPYLGLLSVVVAGAACSRLRDGMLAILPARIAGARAVVAVAAAILFVPLSMATYRRTFALPTGARVVDSHFDNVEKRTNADAFEWLRSFTPPDAVVGFDDRFLDFGHPGYNQMASRIVLQADRYSLTGNQIEATRAHNAAVLKHLADWEPELIHEKLVRYNVSHLLTWNDDAEDNLRRSPLFRPLYRNERVTVWKVTGHEFVYASGPPVRFDDFRFGSERLWWRITNPADGSDLVISTSFHPHWRAVLDGSEIPIAETEDHLMRVTLPEGRHELELRFVRPVWYRILEVGSLLAWVAGSGLLAAPAWRRLLAVVRRRPPAGVGAA